VPSQQRRLTSPMLIILAVTACTSRCATTPIKSPRPQTATVLRVEVNVGGGQRIQTIPLEHYVRGSVPAEMPLGDSDIVVAGRLAQLQAILARTYALANRGRHRHEGFDLCSTTHCQVYRAPEKSPEVANLVDNAVTRTSRLIITDGNGPIQAFFHSNCGGHTSSATDIWGGPAPRYLAGVPDDYCIETPGNNWHLSLDREHLHRILNTETDTEVGQRLDQVVVLRRGPAGRAIRISVKGEKSQVIPGERLRAVINAQLGHRAFRSTLFAVDNKMGQIIFSGQGFGHGVGLCQVGSIARAQKGASVEDILAHYYPGTWIEPYSTQIKH